MLENRFLYWMDKIYGFFVRIGSNLQSLFLLYMRLTWGHQFFLIGIDRWHHISETIQFFAKLGIPYSVFHAYLVAFFELIGGIFLILGLGSRLICIPLFIIMATTLAHVHSEILINFKFLLAPKMFVGADPYPFLIATLLIFCFGPGRLSLDGWLKRWAGHQPKY